MISNVPVRKDLSSQQPIPTEWRQAIRRIVEAIAVGNFALSSVGSHIKLISPDRALKIERNIREYGATPVVLPEEAWETSVCQWMGNRWEAVIDLFTKEEGSSDLVLHLRVTEHDQAFLFLVDSVHVP